jgi:hypothetical protein
LKLNNKTEDLRLALDQRSFEYISTILNNVKLDNDLGRTGFFLREKYLYEKINNLLKENKKLKPFMIYGLAHTHKFYSEKINMFNNNPSVAHYLHTQKGSKCRGKVFSIVTTYFFKEDSDSLITSFKYFEKEDLLKIQNELSDFNHKIIDADSLDFNVLIPKSYDMIIALNNCHKLLQHTRIYYKNTQSKQ